MEISVGVVRAEHCIVLGGQEQEMDMADPRSAFKAIGAFGVCITDGTGDHVIEYIWAVSVRSGVK